MPAFDFLYRLEELVSDLEFFLPPEGPPTRRLEQPAASDVTTAELDVRCGTEEVHWLYSGMLLLQQRKGPLAEYCLRRLCRLAPDRWTNNFNVLLNLALALMLQGKSDEAIPLAKRVVEQHPQHLEARKRYIRILEEAKRPVQEILEQVRAALALTPDDEDLQEKKDTLESQLEP